MRGSGEDAGEDADTRSVTLMDIEVGKYEAVMRARNEKKALRAEVIKPVRKKRKGAKGRSRPGVNAR